MSRKRLFSGIALAVVLAACGDSGGDPLGPIGGPSFDGGPLVGGNRSDSTATGTGTGGGGSTGTSESGGPIVDGN
ncbi:MAG TPA: hypothetical protein VFY65_02445 [Longimicrobium sp.]|nr:hypothetical protein [Longimicrobium sp.]